MESACSGKIDFIQEAQVYCKRETHCRSETSMGRGVYTYMLDGLELEDCEGTQGKPAHGWQLHKLVCDLSYAFH